MEIPGEVNLAVASSQSMSPLDTPLAFFQALMR